MPRERLRTGSSARRVMPVLSSSCGDPRLRFRDVVQAGVEAQVLAPGEIPVQQRLVREQPDRAGAPGARRAAGRVRARALVRRAARAASPARAAASSCRRRWGRTRPGSGPARGAASTLPQRLALAEAAHDLVECDARRVAGSPHRRARSAWTAGSTATVMSRRPRRRATRARGEAPARSPRRPAGCSSGCRGSSRSASASRMPATARESIQLRVCGRDAARIASAMPGASRSITARVASGVTSPGANPVPPVVRTRSQPSLSA